MQTIALLGFAHNDHSQFGEDGSLEKLFYLIAVERGYFAEFGAWDGIHLSNTCALYKKSRSSCYIEGNVRRYRGLQKNITAERVSKVNTFVMIEGHDSLDNILSRHNCPLDIDLLSIDIDSDDLAIWRAMINFTPKVAIIGCNPTMPFVRESENVRRKNFATFSLSLIRRADARKYDLECATNTNLIFPDRNIDEEAGLRKFDTYSMQRKSRYFWGQHGACLSA